MTDSHRKTAAVIYNPIKVLNADLPGIDPGSVDVDVDGQVLTIRAQRTESIEDGAMNPERPGDHLIARPSA